MRSIVQTALRSLQGLARARAVGQCRRVAALEGSTWPSGQISDEHAWESAVERLLREMSSDDLIELRIKRAMYLRMLLRSATARLQTWADRDSLADMPPSHLFEWVAYDLEQLELHQIEATLRPVDEARYIQELAEFEGFD